MNKEEFTFFWPGPFSQWAKSPFKDTDGREFNCAEQYMMYYKAMYFNDIETAERIMLTDSPKLQQKHGREVKGFIKEEWDKVARDIVYQGNYLKYTQNLDYKKMLFATKGTTLVEASPYDCIWGIGLDRKDPKRFDRSNWRGTNWLGETLTRVRDDLMKEVLY